MFSAPDTRTQLIRDNDGHILFRYNRTIFFCFVFFYLLNFFFLFFSFIGANRSRQHVENKICWMFLKTYCTITCNTVKDNERDFTDTKLQRELKKIENKDDNILSC